MNVTFAIGAALLLCLFYSWTSRINGMFFFGRSAGPELRDSSEGRKITRQYLVAMMGSTAAAVLVAWFGGLHGRHLAAMGPCLEMGAFWAIFARANRQVRALEVSRGELGAREAVVQVELLDTPRYWIPGVPMTLLPGVLGVVAFAAALLLSGQGNGVQAAWSTWNRSVETHHLDTLFGMSIGLLVAATAMLLVFRNSVRLRTRMAQYSVRASVVMEWIGLAILIAVLGCNYLGFSLNPIAKKTFLIAGAAAVLATVLWNQARMKRFVLPPVELGADDRWRWGLFYVDRNDPALFVQSRCGAGYTLNYGRMMAWPISLATMACFVTMLFLPSHK